MQFIIHTTGKLSDRRIIEYLKGVAEEFDGNLLPFNYGPLSIPVAEIESISDSNERYLITEASARTDANELLVTFKRGKSGQGSDGQTNHALRIPSPYFDEIIITPNKQNQPSIDDCMRLELFTNDFIELHVPEEITSEANGASQLLHKEMAGLTKLHRQMVSTAEKQRFTYEAEHQQRLSTLEEEKQKQFAAID
ncbi:MAG: hypothetical protein V7701_16650, partial [Sneathiella sp.]